VPAVKAIKTFFYQILIDILTSLPITNFTSRLVDKMIVRIEGD
jgi:hypothetical protein